jgi:plasmid maintenance system killer protein
VRLFARPRTRVFQASVIVNRLDDAAREDLLALDLTSAAEAIFTPPGRDPLTNDLLIQAIEHSIVVGGTWRTTFNFEERDTTIFFTLDDPVEGRLNFSRLGF